MKKTICYVRMKNGDRVKKKSNPKKNGGKFIHGGVTYDAPTVDNKEVLDLNHWLWGRKRYAFYREDAKTPIPLHSDAKWRQVANNDEDTNFLANVIEQALKENGSLGRKADAAILLSGVTLVFLLLHHFW